MNSNKYILDRYDDGFGVFLEYQNEENQLLIKQEEISPSVNEGDIVEIHSLEDNGNRFQVLETETSTKKKTVNDLIEKLKNKTDNS